MKQFLTEQSIAIISICLSVLILVAAAMFGIIKLSFFIVFYFMFIFLIFFSGLSLLNSRIKLEAEKARGEQARKILRVAEQTLPYLRLGLDISSAKKVVEVIFPESRAIAIAMTDEKKILAFTGAGQNHHLPGKEIITQASREALKTGKTMILNSSKDIGCPNESCPLKAAVIIPLQQQGKSVGTLKFYYGHEGKVAESEIALAEGLAHLLETQIELSQLHRLEMLACQAELKALQAQINPHFFFNVLNTAISYCRSEPHEARKLLLDFSNFFRKTIENGDESLITLDSELNYLINYLELEKARFGDRLIYNISVSKNARTWPIPPFTLQPLVENAIHHGFPQDRPLVIKVKDHTTPDLRIIETKDNGNGIAADRIPSVLKKGYGKGLGIGLNLINERIKLLFGNEYGLTIDSSEKNGTTVRVIMPKNARVGFL